MILSRKILFWVSGFLVLTCTSCTSGYWVKSETDAESHYKKKQQFVKEEIDLAVSARSVMPRRYVSVTNEIRNLSQRQLLIQPNQVELSIAGEPPAVIVEVCLDRDFAKTNHTVKCEPILDLKKTIKLPAKSSAQIVYSFGSKEGPLPMGSLKQDMNFKNLSLKRPGEQPVIFHIQMRRDN